MEIKFKKFDESAILPKRATTGSAAYDLFVPENMLVRAGRQVIDLRFAIELPIGYEAKVEPRSGYSSKGFAGSAASGMEPDMRFDCDVLLGKVDSDYRGTVGVIVCNRDCRTFFVKRGQRIAQMTIYKVEDADFVETDELSETDRGTGGYGSSGK